MGRIDLGFVRTECACEACSEFCKWLPGYLLPEDLTRLAGTGAPDAVLAWAEDHLLASSGFALYRRDVGIFRVPTLVPARQDNGCACHWLMPSGKCAVWENAPFGCAMFDQHQDQHAYTERSTAGANRLCAEWFAWTQRRDSLYYQIWTVLSAQKRTAPNRLESQDRYYKTLNGG